MRRLILTSLFVAAQSLQLGSAQEAPQQREELKCDPNAKPGEGFKEVRYYRNGKLHIEYCTGGKKRIIIDHGQNG